MPTLVRMIRPNILRKLDLESASAPGRPRHIASGSALVAIGDFLYVAPDDELHLGCFRRSSDAPGALVRLFPGELPGDHAERKAIKPDLEALVVLPASPGYPHGALLAVPSGSTPQRHRGAMLQLDADGAAVGTPDIVDFSGLYTGLLTSLPGIDIEGAVVIGDALVLLHRGNRSHPRSALIELPLAEVQAGLTARRAIDAMEHDVSRVDLGMVEGVALSITDGALLPDGRLVVTAVAEQSPDSYQDGPCLGAAVAVIARDGRVCELHHLEPIYKVEGVQAWVEEGVTRLLLVTDSDDEDTASLLLEAQLPAALQRPQAAGFASAVSNWLIR